MTQILTYKESINQLNLIVERLNNKLRMGIINNEHKDIELLIRDLKVVINIHEQNIKLNYNGGNCITGRW